MAIPKKPNKTADDFIGEAVATRVERSTLVGKQKTSKGRPKGPAKVQFPARVTVELLETIRKNANGNISYFTEKVFREYFSRNNIKIDDI